MSTQSSRESWPEMEAQTENLDPANAPLDTSEPPAARVGDVVLYQPKTWGAQPVPATVTAVLEDSRVCLKIMFPPFIPEDPIDAEQRAFGDIPSYLPGTEPGRWTLRD
ncbi:hypothetical protein SEA_CHUBSTER_88 [Arthrobacter phage Chubster]|uniref:Uncharacterized protein n=1 Tax=Arthrobacter phage Chubster TaxID=1897527 RepID=A0A1I9SCR2_9CAUD|nr:hypothetical protein SEA_CHUBSTER_88 [Arthrobacter phage Chubster]